MTGVGEEKHYGSATEVRRLGLFVPSRAGHRGTEKMPRTRFHSVGPGDPARKKMRQLGGPEIKRLVAPM